MASFYMSWLLKYTSHVGFRTIGGKPHEVIVRHCYFRGSSLLIFPFVNITTRYINTIRLINLRLINNSLYKTNIFSLKHCTTFAPTIIKWTTQNIQHTKTPSHPTRTINQHPKSTPKTRTHTNPSQSKSAPA